MKAAVLRETEGSLSVERVELLDLAPGRVLVKTHATPFCSTDVNNARGEIPKVPPTILGHASIGEVVELGEGVTSTRPGQRVIVPGTPECSACYYCGIGRPDQCSELFDLGGVYPNIARTREGDLISCAGCVGGYAEYMSVSANQVFPIESDLPSDVLSMLGCGITTGVGGIINVAQLTPQESIVIIGAGHVGLWAIQAARMLGAGPIIAVEPHEERRNLAGQLGADYTAAPEEAPELVYKLTAGRGADVVFESAGPPESQELAVNLSRRAGTVVLSGVKRVKDTVSLPQPLISLQSRKIISTQNGGVRMRRDLPRYTRLLERGFLNPDPILTRRYDLDDINTALHRSDQLEDICGVIVFPQ